MHEIASTLAQAQPTATPDELKVTLVDEGKAWWRDFVVPVATLTAALVGGVGGVVIGGRMNRTTMRSLEDERAERETRLHDQRLHREEAAEQRRGLGATLALRNVLASAGAILRTEHETDAA